MRYLIGLVLVAFCIPAKAQELYVYTEPASNIPARALTAKYAGKFLDNKITDRIESRQMAEVQLGLNKNWMLKSSVTFSDMYTNAFRWESAKLYTKYRFLSMDDVHRHFRMAAFAEGTYSRNPLMFDEISIDGDQSGFRAGVVMTQLWHKLAVSSTLGYLESLKDQPDGMHHKLPQEAYTYSLSAGYLLLPRKYTSYKQTNLNLYAELLGQQTVDVRKSYLDFAPAIQFIFASTTKLNLGYRFELNGSMDRMARNSWMVSVEKTFLNSLKRKNGPQ